MAKKNFFQKIKDWFTGGSGGGKSSAAKTHSSSNLGSGYTSRGNERARSAYESQRQKNQEREKKRREETEKRKQAYAVKQQEYKSMGVVNNAKAPFSDTNAAKRTVKTVNKAVEKSQKNKPTYTGLDGKQTKYSKLARDVTEHADLEAKAHPRLYKASEGLLSGATLSASRVLEKKYASDNVKKNLKAGDKEAVKQLGKKKAAAYEIGGELVGGAITMGGTEKLALKGATKVAPKATAQVSKSVASKVARSKVVQNAAKKGAVKELTKAGITNATEKEIAKLAGKKAGQIGAKAAPNIMRNIAGDLTGGLLYDVNSSYADSDNAKEFAKNMAINAAMSVGMGALGNTIASRSALKEALKNRGVTDDLAEHAIKRILKDRDNVTKKDVEEVSKLIKSVDTDKVAPAVRNAEVDVPTMRNAEVEAPNLNVREGAKSFDTNEKLVPPTRNAVQDMPPFRNEINGSDSKFLRERLTPPMPREESKIPTGSAKELGDNANVSTKELNAEPKMELSLKGNESKSAAPMKPSVVKAQQTRRFNKNVAELNDMAPKDVSVGKGTKTIFKGMSSEQRDITNEFLERKAKEGADEIRMANNRLSNGLFKEKINPEQAQYDSYKKIYAQSEDADKGSLARLESLLNDGGEVKLEDWTDAIALASKYETTNPRATEIGLQLGSRYATEHGQGLYAVKCITKMSPAYRKTEFSNYAKSVCKKMLNVEGEEVDNFIESVIQAEHGMSADEFFSQLSKMPIKTEEDKIAYAMERTLLCKNLMEYAPPNLFQVLNNWRYASLLGKPSTQITNWLGNAGGQVVNKMDVATKWAWERTLKNRGVEKTTAFLTVSEKRAMRGADDSEISKIIDPRLKKAMTDQFSPQNKKYGDTAVIGAKYKADSSEAHATAKNALNTLNKAASKMNSVPSKYLEECDKFFYKTSYVDTYARYLKAHGADIKTGKMLDGSEIPDTLLDRADNRAITTAEELTYKRKNDFIELIDRVNQKGLKADARWWEKAGAVAVSSQVPFARVSVNMFTQSWAHSSLGFVEGAGVCLKGIRTGNINLINEGCEKLAKGTTGVGLGVMGYFFACNSLDDNVGLVANLSGDDKSQDYQKQAGALEYSLKIGDNYFDISGLNPLAGVMLSGALIGQKMKDYDTSELGVDGIVDLALGSFEVLVNNSFLENINNLVEMGGYSKKGSVVGKINQYTAQFAGNYAQQFVPTWVRGISRATVKGDVDTSAHGAFEGKSYLKPWVKQANTLKASLPVLSRTLPTKIDAMGEHQKAGVNGNGIYGNNVVSALVKNQIDPFRSRKVKLSNEEREMLKLRNSGYDVTLPKVNSSDKITVGNKGAGLQKEFTLNGKQNEAAQKAQKYSTKLVDRLIDQGVFGDGNGSRAMEVRSALNGKTYAQSLAWVMKQPEYTTKDEEGKAEIINHLTNSSIRQYDAKKYAATKVGKMTESQFRVREDLTPKQQKNFADNKDELKQAGLTEDDIMWVYDNAMRYHQSESNGKMYRDISKDVTIPVLLESDKYTAEQKALLYNTMKKDSAKEWDGVSVPRGSSRGKGKGKRSGGSRKSSGGSSSKTSSAKPKIKSDYIKASDYKVTQQSYKSMARSSKKSSKVIKNSMKIKPKIKLEVKDK